jgi:hypothetical protein
MLQSMEEGENLVYEGEIHVEIQVKRKYGKV